MKSIAPTMSTPLLKRTSTLILLVVIGAVGAVFSVTGFIHQIHRTHAQAVFREFGEAYEKSSKFPPGMLRAEDALFRFKRIDPGYSSEDFKRAMNDYILAMQGAVDALKAGKDTTPFDKPMEEAHDRMHRLANE